MLVLLVGLSIGLALPSSSFQRLLDLTGLESDDDYEDAVRRSVREANPESFSDYFRKLQLAQSELQKNASVGEEEIEKVFKNHGLDTGNETHELSTTTESGESNTKQPFSTTDFEYPTSTQKYKKENCKSEACMVYTISSTEKPQKKLVIKPAVPTASLSTTTSTPDDLDTSTTESDTTVFPSTTTSYSSSGWWGVSRKSKPKHLKSTIARQVVNKIKTSRRRTSHYD